MNALGKIKKKRKNTTDVKFKVSFKKKKVGMAFCVHSCSLRCSIAQKTFPDFFVERKSIFLISYFELFFTRDKKAHSSSVLGWLSQLFLAWPSWTTIAVVCVLAGLHDGFWIIRNILLLRLSAVFPSVNLFWFLSVVFFPLLDDS